ncbi:uncharacterized protein LOC130986167 isoform X2 [Salvia miltiorrhiza]|uniref:uncharacterized protein LOC130986167 isoform X2 n=1 Tax=Salvia miltiorrhiza TaxID=226208 RepID=UPI0025ABF8E9|nr:uncharacterized protein LOC130986167 isoform X2 [Salvia miltiorrhiza]
MSTAEKMKAAEKLLSLLSERKKSIIEHVKQQTESYSQHLASKLLIEGIDPPSWLRDPSNSASKELNEEDLISRLLSQYPQPSARCSIACYPGHKNLMITGAHEKFSDGDVELPAANEDLDRKNDPAAPGFSGEDHGECALKLDASAASREDQTDERILNNHAVDHEKFSHGDVVEIPAANEDLDQKNDPSAPGFNSEDHGECVLKLDASAASPEDQTDERILNNYTGIQRSKSRQKALELRSSAKAPAKSGVRHSSINDVVSSQIRFSLSSTNQPCQNDEVSQLGEPCIIDSQSSENRNVVEAHCLSREVGLAAHSESRSETYAEAPISVVGSFPLGCSSKDYNENAASQDARVKRKESIPISDTEHADNHVRSPKSAGPSAICSQSFRDRAEENADFLCEDEEKNVCSGEIIRSEISSRRQSCGCDSPEAGSSFDDYQGIDITMKDAGDDLPPDCVDGSLMKINFFNLHNEGCDAQESVLEDFPSLSSIQCNACIVKISDLKVPSASAKVYGGILASSSAGSARRVNDLLELSGLVKPSDECYRVTRSQTHSYGKETYRPVTYNEGIESTISDCEGKSAEQLQNSSGQYIPPYLGTHTALHDDENGKLVMASELCLPDHVDKSCLSSSNYSKQRRGLESEVALTPSDSFASVEPKQFELKEMEEYYLKAFTSTSGKKLSCSLHDPDVSLDKGICGGNNQPSSSKELPGMSSDISSKGQRAHRDSFQPDVQESPDTQIGNFGPVIGSEKLNASKDSSEAELNCRSSEVQHENLLSKMVDITDIQIPPMKLQVKHGLESSPVHCMEQGNLNDEASNKGELVSSAPESKNSRLSYAQHSAKDPAAKSDDCSIKKARTNSIAVKEIKQYPAQQSQILSWPESEVCSNHGDSSLGKTSLGKSSMIRLDDKNSSLERRLRHAKIESWPQVKRRKVEHQQAHGFATSKCFRVTKPRAFQRDQETMEIDIDSGLVVHVEKSTNDGICSEVHTNLMEEIQSAISSQHGEVESCYIEKNETSPVINDEQLVATISSVAMKESRNSQGCFIEGTRTSSLSCNYHDPRMSGDKQCRQNLCNLENNTDNLSSEILNLSSTLLEEIQQSPNSEDGLQVQHSVLCSSNEDLQLTDFDHMPVYEGFIVNAQTDTGELDFAADEFDLGELELPRTALERASILAEICRSASLDTPSSHFKFQDTRNLCKSLSDDGHLEHMEFGNDHPLDADVGIFQSCSSSSDDYKDAVDGMPYSASLAYSGERYGWDSRNQPPSPVGKLWNQLSFHTGSSGKCSSSNPELTCFPIEEDPSSSGENKTTEENTGDTQDETDSPLSNHCDKRQPLTDLTNVCTNPPMSKFSVTGTPEKALFGHKYQGKKDSETRKKQTSSTRAADGRKHQLSSIGPNAIKRAKESVNNSISKPIVSTKTSLQGQDQKLSLRESRRNNIVSNVSSFIPQLQKKQAATAFQGKRDVKVKALEAAEAAKRVEEQKENERKRRKEALKLERAKLEEKNLKHMELEKKKKEEERKKKDADVIAKKRLRGEEEKKEKEKKRMRLESRQRQREQEEKKRVARPEKENQRTKDEQMNRKKEFNNESKRQQNKETTRGECVALQKTDNNLTSNEVVVNYEECGTSGLSCDGEGMHAVDKSPRNEDLIVQNSHGKSYEISPYQCSDDEDEEDDELPTKKYIPSWSSKSSIALFLPLQHQLDPDVIFPLESFCSIDEILLPRKLQQKQVAA